MKSLAIEFPLLFALIVPPIPSLLAACSPSNYGQETQRCFLSILGIAVIGSTLLGFPAMFMIGLPLHLALKSNGQVAMLAYAAAGVVAGALTILIVSAIDNRPYDFILWSLGLMTGLLNAAIFWLIRRPDGDQALSASNSTSA